MARTRTGTKRASGRIERLLRASVAMGVLALSFALLPAAMASAASSSIGVFVDQPTTTLPSPATTIAPATTTPTTAAPSTPAATVPTTGPVTTAAPDTLPDVLPPQKDVVPAAQSGFVAKAKSAAKSTQKVISDVISGKPVADAVAAVLPAKVADVVVPAVRTASTFVFPIGLAGAVIAFLALQQRIDASDPKLSAAPLAHDDDVVKFL